nr:MAG TPA: hypothetical protein [Caudoviricetes sp.]
MSSRHNTYPRRYLLSLLAEFLILQYHHFQLLLQKSYYLYNSLFRSSSLNLVY